MPEMITCLIRKKDVLETFFKFWLAIFSESTKNIIFNVKCKKSEEFIYFFKNEKLYRYIKIVDK